MPIGKLRAALLASAALAALCLPPAQPVWAGPDPCTYSTSEQALICSGDQSGGISEYYWNAVIVRDLSRDMGSIRLFGREPITLVTEPGPYGIIAFGDYGHGISVVTDGAARVENNLRVATGGPVRYGNGIVASVFSGTGPVEVINSGDLTLDGYALRGIEAEFGTGGGTARVENHGAITLDGDLSRGILAESVAGDASVTNDGRITIVGDRTVGLRARTYEGATVASIVNSGEMTLSGAYSVGIVAYGANESRAINSGSITMTGPAGRAIVARGDNSAAVQNDGPLTLNGDRSYGIDARVFGPVLVTSTGDITATGSASIGIFAGSTGQGSVTVDNSADISTSGGTSRGLWATATNGDTNVTNSGTISNTGPGESLGIGAFTTTGSVTVENSGTVSTAGGHAIMATTSVGDIDIANDAALIAGRDGIYAAVLVNGSADIVSRGNISGVTGGIKVRTTGADVSIVSVGDVTTSDGFDADAIHGYAYGNSVVIDSSGLVATVGNFSAAIHGEAIYGDAEIVSRGALTTRGERAYGIEARGQDVTVDNGATIVTEGLGASGIHVMATGRAYVDNVAAITTSGDNGLAIEVRGDYGVDLTNSAALSTGGDFATAIRASVIEGNSNVANSGAISVTGSGALFPAYGIVATTLTGSANVDNSGAVSVVGGDSIFASTNVGDVNIVNDAPLTAGADGIVARSNNTGAVSVVNRGDMAVGQRGIAATTLNGDISIKNDGNIVSRDSSAIDATAAGPGSLTIYNSGDVTGGSGQGGAGVELFAAGAARLENHGIIQSLNDRAIVNDPGSGPATIDNRNMIIGSVSLDDGEDNLANPGWFEARGDSDFGSGIDEMVNSGTLHVSDSGGADQVTIFGLESFANGSTGLITMVDGRTGDRLTLPGLAAFNGGGAIALDAALASTGAPADLLTVSGVVSGTTLVAVNNVAHSSGTRGADDIFVIDQGSRPRGDEFRLSGGPISVGFLFYDLRPDDDGSNRWELYEAGTNWQGIDALGAVMTGLQNIWHAGVSAWHQRMSDLVSLAALPQLIPAADFPGAPPTPRLSGGVWMRGFGENADFDPASAADFHQSIAAAQGGVDGVARGPLGGDSVIAGLLGAYVRSDVDIEHMPDRVVYEGGSIGGYLVYLNGGFHADLLVKADLLTVTYQQRALSGDFDARSIGGSFELGYKFDIGDGFYLNPLGQLAYVASDIDDGSLAETVPMSFADGDSLRSRAGLRAGYRAALADATIEPYLDAHFLHEFSGGNRGGVFGYLGARNELESWGIIGGGIQVTTARFTAFANLQSFVGDEIDGFAGQGGLRWSF
jgi:outer membrane autotransporter protein